jgi:hypothetical protein
MGDYHRYLAEFATGDKRKDSANNTYKAASDVPVTELPHILAVLDLPSTSPDDSDQSIRHCTVPTLCLLVQRA